MHLFGLSFLLYLIKADGNGYILFNFHHQLQIRSLKWILMLHVLHVVSFTLSLVNVLLCNMLANH